MSIIIKEKPKEDPKGPSQLPVMVPYKVVNAREPGVGVSVGDIVLRFPSNGNSVYVFNATQQKMLWHNATDRAWEQRFVCLRAHEIAEITFCVDPDARPSGD